MSVTPPHISDEGRRPAPRFSVICLSPRRWRPVGRFRCERGFVICCLSPKKPFRSAFLESAFFFCSLSCSPVLSFSASCKHCTCAGALREARRPERGERLHVRQVRPARLAAAGPGGRGAGGTVCTPPPVPTPRAPDLRLNRRPLNHAHGVSAGRGSCSRRVRALTVRGPRPRCLTGAHWRSRRRRCGHVPRPPCRVDGHVLPPPFLRSAAALSTSQMQL